MILGWEEKLRMWSISRRCCRFGSSGPKGFLLLTIGAFFLGLLLTGGTGVAARGVGSDDIRGVAVTVVVQKGTVAPAIFLGTRVEAAAASGEAFHFHQVIDSLHIMRPGTVWEVGDGAGDGSGPGRQGLAIVIRMEEESWLPGIFRGPQELAREISLSWAEAEGLRLPHPDQVLVLPEDNARVRSIPLGTTVRSLGGS
jgi:hypothetical protein